MFSKKKKDDTLSNFDVTTHTAGMWKYNPVPEFPEPYPEYHNSYTKDDNAEVIAARVRGKKHKHEGSNCDDWYEYRLSGDSVIAVVADGAGSRPLSRVGAMSSCIAAADYLENELKKLELQNESCEIKTNLSKALDSKEFISECSRLALLMQNSADEAYRAIEAAHEIRKTSEELIEKMGKVPETRDFSSTFLAAVIIPVNVNNQKEHFVITIQIGDGMIASVDDKTSFANALRILGNADKGGFAGETEFLTTNSMRTPENLMSRTKIGRRKITSLMIMTDGVADDYYPNDPQLLRLYLDMKLNNIIGDFGADKDAINAGNTKNKGYSEKIPLPVAYPWVNDSDVNYSLQYCRNILDNTKLTLEELWGMDNIINISSLRYHDTPNISKDRSEMLSIWLDNYVERGSFDDRTLVIINVN